MDSIQVGKAWFVKESYTTLSKAFQVAEESFIGPRYYCWKTTSKQHIDIKSIGYWRQIEAKTIDVKTILKCRYSSTLCFNDNTVLDGCSTVLSSLEYYFSYSRIIWQIESIQLGLERESKGLKESNVRSSCTKISSTKTLFPRFAFCLRFKYVLRPHVLGLQVFGFWTYDLGYAYFTWDCLQVSGHET